ncbi:MAG: ATP-binding protein [Deltaproteobacteria bacterium]|nr:ATP-binding protein [Deltaproteobacteria bacterium]
MRVVITGGPCSGKTTLVQELAARGFATVPEAAMIVIDELNQELGVEEQKVWRRSHLSEFQTRVLRKQLELEASVEADRGQPVFMDRGCLDGLAYCTHFRVEPPAALLAVAEGKRYDQVFVLDTLDDFVFRSDEGRTSNQETSVALGAALEQTYQGHGYSPIRVAAHPVAARVDLVLSTIGTG